MTKTSKQTRKQIHALEVLHHVETHLSVRCQAVDCLTPRYEALCSARRIVFNAVQDLREELKLDYYSFNATESLFYS